VAGALKHIVWPVGFAALLMSVLLLVAVIVPAPATSNVITNVAVSSTGRYVAAGTHDGRVTVCVLEGGSSCRTFTNRAGELNDLQFSPDEQFLAIANDNIQLVGVVSGSKSFFVRDDERRYGTVRFNMTGNEILTINSRSRIELIDVKSRTVSAAICCSSFYGEVGFFRSATRVANAGHWPRVWTRRGQLVGSLTRDREYETFRPIVVEETAGRIFMGSQDGRVYVWSLVDFALLGRSPAQGDYVDTIALAPKLEMLAYSGFGKQVHLWSGAPYRTPVILTAKSSSNIAALPDGVSILFGTDSGTIQTWRLGASPFMTSELHILH